jgi:Asp-tRNA(Asn)/Glu-tRNA(Gln) amidotransferase A subunit family amidase
MANEKLSFEQWRTLARKDHRQVAETFFSRYEELTPESRSALIAAHPERGTLLQKTKAGCVMENAPLAGVPYILQDMFDVQGLPTRCGAPFGEPFEALLEDSCLLAHTLGDHGATLLAKTVPSEFGWDIRGRNPSFGDCPHAHGLRYVCGGGAGSCAHAVAGGWAPIAFGLDTCGGIRIPAAFHGLFGFRMENNNYARDGVFPLVPSLDAVGWVTAHIDDLLSSLKIFYNLKNGASESAPRGYLLKDSLEGVSAESRTGLMQLTRPLDIDDEPAVSKMLAKRLQPAAKAFRTIRNRELYAIHQHWIEEYRNDYDRNLLKRIEAGRTYSPAESEEAAMAQQNIRASLISFFRDYDYLILPVSPLPSPEKNEWDPALEEELIQLNAPLSLSFLPALILPYECGRGKYNAAQIIVNPRKLHFVPRILEQVRRSYAGD